MFWADRITKTAGVTLLLLVVLIIVNVVLITAMVGDADPTARGDIEGILRDINDKKALFALGTASSIAVDAIILPVVGALLYLVFRDRSRALAMVTFAGFVSAGVMFLIADAASIAIFTLAEDFVEEGGAGGIAVGDPAILASARALAAFAGLIEPAGSTSVALSLVAIGCLLVWAPNAEVNPPRWHGGLALLAGAAFLVGWIGAVNEAAGIVIVSVGYVSLAIFLAILGGWLVVQPEREAHPAAMMAPAQSP